MFRSVNSSSLLKVSGIGSIPRNRNRARFLTKSVQSSPPNGGSGEGNLLMKGFESRREGFSSMGNNNTGFVVDSFFASPVKFEYQALTVGSESSLMSLRLMQLRKEQENLPLPKTPPKNLCCLGSSVLSLASLISETQRVFLPEDSDPSCLNSGSALTASSVDSGYSIMWLFRKVFVSSPVLMAGILDLMGEYTEVALANEIGWVIADLEWEKIMEERRRDSSSWSEIGVDIQYNTTPESNNTEMSDQRKQDAYEKLIKQNETSSLILLNYAQFLYRIQKDLDRAEVFFKKAVEAEPIDGEAMSKYALFLWEERGDLEKAEDMFLAAIEATAGNSHHLATYAHFLWVTGGSDICVPMLDGVC